MIREEDAMGDAQAEGESSPARVPDLRPWQAAALAEIDGLAIDAEAEGCRSPAPGTLATAREVMQACARADLSQPLVDHDSAAGVEIYLKEGDSALLIAIREDGDVCVFREGPGPGDRGRDRRQAGGGEWVDWLSDHLRRLGPASPG
jgi:hypothetical protein